MQCNIHAYECVHVHVYVGLTSISCTSHDISDSRERSFRVLVTHSIPCSHSHHIAGGRSESSDVILRTSETYVRGRVDELSDTFGVGVLHRVVQITPATGGSRRTPLQGEAVGGGVRGQCHVCRT